jgi:hypothetical protein
MKQLITEPSVHGPEHYRWVPGVECKQVTRHFSFFSGSAIKYIWRAGKKAGASRLEDLMKARECISNEIQLELEHQENTLK